MNRKTGWITLTAQCLACFGLLIAYNAWPRLSFGATLQPNDIVEYGSSEFVVLQTPLKLIIDQEEKKRGVLLRSLHSGNHSGYIAKWKAGEFLWLTGFHGTNGRKRVEIGDIIPGATLPVKATWFTGILHLPIGDFDYHTQTYPAMVRLTIVKGKVVSMSIAENAPRVYTLDGVEESGDGQLNDDARGHSSPPVGTIEP